jgi:hypothetical protein
MTEESKTAAEQGVRALHDFLSAYLHGNRHAWMHDIIGTEFDQGEAHALTGLALIPGVRTALDTIDEQLGSHLEVWHEFFKPRESQ